MIGRNGKLRVIAVGGAGAMGRHAVRTVVRLDAASVLAVADVDAERAQRLVDEVGTPAEVVVLDATDSAAMRVAFVDYDVVINTMGPFAKFALPILTAAIESGCHYLDIGDDWQSTMEAFELDAAARQRGLHVVIGLGSSPGTTNVCAAVAHGRLDEVDELLTGWKLSAAVAEEEEAFPATGAASAAFEHWLLQCSGSIKVWDDGRLLDAAPVEPVDLDFPGVGPVTVYTMGHPEPLTLPVSFPGITRSLNLQSGPGWLFENLRSVAARFEAGDVSLAEGASLLENPPRPRQRAPRDQLPVEWAMAVGRRDGRPARVAVFPSAFPPGRMGGNTGIPLAVGVELLRRGLLKDVGVHAPETAVDPQEFFELLARMTSDDLDADSLLVIREVVQKS